MSNDIIPSGWEAGSGLEEGFVFCALHNGYLPVFEDTQLCAACVSAGFISVERARGQVADAVDELERDIQAQARRDRAWDVATRAAIDALLLDKVHRLEGLKGEQREHVKSTIEREVLESAAIRAVHARQSAERSACARIRAAALELRPRDRVAAIALRATADPDSLPPVDALVASASGVRFDTIAEALRSATGTPGERPPVRESHADDGPRTQPVDHSDPQPPPPDTRPVDVRSDHRARVEDVHGTDLLETWCQRGTTASTGT